ncbi:lysostaphin resistance A-like protein [Thermoproteota archaeon]
MLILSYSIILVASLILVRIDLKKSFSSFFRITKYKTILASLGFAFLFQIIYYPVNVILGSNVELISFPTLRGFENYAFFSLFTAFISYLVFSVFGAFTEEVAYRGYVQDRISSRFGFLVGIFTSALLFSFQHIHVFQFNWLGRFFQTQFIYVMMFGIFVGYLYLKSKSQIWNVIAFHSLMNILNISIPIQISNSSYFLSAVATVTSFVILILLLNRFIKQYQIIGS